MIRSRFARLMAGSTIAGAALLAAHGPAYAESTGQAGPGAALVAPCVQKVTVVNNAGFVASFRASTRTGVETASTDEYPINQWRTIDLTTTDLPEGTDVRPVVHAVAGTDRPGNSFVSYCQNGQTATYSITGTTLNYSVTLLT